MSTTTKNKTAADLADQLKEGAPLATTGKGETKPAKANGAGASAEEEESGGPIDQEKVEQQIRAAQNPRRRTATKATKARQLVTGSEERIHIWYIGETGKEEWCNEYAMGEIQRASSLEGFIRKYLVPQFDYGEYVIRVGKPGTPREKLAELPSVYIRKPKDEAEPRARETSTIRELMEMSKQIQNEGKNIDPVQQLERMLALQKQLNEGKGDASSALMMMMMMDRERGSQKGGLDPIVMKLVDRLEQLERRVSKRSEGPSMPPMPPPPPPLDPMEGFSKMIEAFAAMQKSMQPPPPPPPQQNSRQEFLQELRVMQEMFGAKKEEMGFRDYIAMMKEIRELDPTAQRAPGSQGPRSLEDQLKEYRHMKQVFGEMSQEFGGSTGGFWDFARDFLGGTPVGEKLGEALQEAIGGKGQEQPPGTQNRQLPPGSDDEDEDDGALEIPPSFNTHAEKMDHYAQSDPPDVAMLIRSALEGLQHLAAKSPDFRPYVMKVIHLARANKKKDCLKLLGEILIGIHEAGTIKHLDTVKKVILGVREHWLAVCKALGMEHDEDPDPYVPHTEHRASSRVPPVGGPSNDERPEPEVPEVEDDDDAVEITDEDYARYAAAAAGEQPVSEPDPEPQEAVGLDTSIEQERVEEEAADENEDAIDGDDADEEDPPTAHEPPEEDESSDPEPTGEVEEDDPARDLAPAMG